jgi:5-methyltetrahydropteroyltriglutamate--homocysteine methyltransferase
MSPDLTMPALATLRVDCVGSFLRPERLKKAYSDRADAVITDETLAEIMDDSVAELIATEQRHGLPILTDGEYRRYTFMESFAEVAGMDQWRAQWNHVIGSMRTERAEPAVQAKGVNPLLLKQEVVTERLRLLRNKPKQEYEFAQGLATTPVKASLLNPDRVLQSVDIEGSRQVYPTADEFVADVVTVSREIVSGLRDAGCRYVHIDAPGYTAYVDPASLEAMRERGEDADAALARAIAADNAVIADFPDVTFGIHVCRGNRHSRWHREGAYDAIAERLFGQLNHHRLLLEYDDERSGSFAPLRYVPRDKVAVLGLVTTKSPVLESKDELLRRIEEASRYLPVEQLALSPQCGFASDIAGNKITEEAQWRKIDRILEVAGEVWGRA